MTDPLVSITRWARPGADLVRDLGGLGRFMGFHGAVLTDSGGFQAMSLARINTIDEKGIRFRSHLDGAPLSLTPESAAFLVKSKPGYMGGFIHQVGMRLAEGFLQLPEITRTGTPPAGDESERPEAVLHLAAQPGFASA